MDALSLTTAGSVDDGKSTLIGRLLLDSGTLPEDQRPADADTQHLAWLTDGLKAEREQGITIDVAYRYFRTKNRRFTIADAPGHFEYTRNMVTAASTSQVALVLVDARSGIVEQTKRHAFIASLVGVSAIALCVNKMDLVEWRQDVFEAIRDEFVVLTQGLRFARVEVLPLSALLGDNVATRSSKLAWYAGPTILEYLERISVTAEARSGARLVAQHTSLTDGGPLGPGRLVMGRVAGSDLRVGQQIEVWPERTSTRIMALGTMSGPLSRAVPGQSVVATVPEEVVVRRGDLLTAGPPPVVARRMEATVCWMSATQPLIAGKPYTLRTAAGAVAARVERVVHQHDVRTLSIRSDVAEVGVNDVALVSIHAEATIAFDPYSTNRMTGSFILIDPGTHQTLAAGMFK